MIPDFYSLNSEWPRQIERIVELLGRIGAIEELSERTLELRRSSRIRSVHASAAIEGNTLTVSQVESVARGESVLAPPREVREIENALAAYDALASFDPWSVDDLLRAHGLLTAGLVAESGAFRSVEVEIVNARGEVLHAGSRSEKAPRLITELLQWGSEAADHPVIVSSAVHFLIEYIHPFRDGNGRIGRLWQTLVLSRWRPELAWLSTESLIRQNQTGYYQALQASHDPEIDARAFIDYMIRMLTESLESYEAQAANEASSVGISDGINVGIDEEILAELTSKPSLSAAELGRRLGVSARTVERHLAVLREMGRIRREGSRKAGRWVVTQP